MNHDAGSSRSQLNVYSDDHWVCIKNWHSCIKFIVATILIVFQTSLVHAVVSECNAHLTTIRYQSARFFNIDVNNNDLMVMTDDNALMLSKIVYTF